MTNPDTKWAQASLRISSETVTPEEITSRLDLVPTQAFHKGDPYRPASPDSALRPTHLWLLKSGLDESQPLPLHIRALLDRLKSKTVALNTLTPHIKLEIFCGFSSSNGQGGFSLPPQLLSELAALNIVLTLDLYPM